MTVNITIELIGEGGHRVSERVYDPIGPEDVPAQKVYRYVIKMLDDHIDLTRPGTSAD